MAAVCIMRANWPSPITAITGMPATCACGFPSGFPACSLTRSILAAMKDRSLFGHNLISPQRDSATLWCCLAPDRRGQFRQLLIKQLFDALGLRHIWEMQRAIVAADS